MSASTAARALAQADDPRVIAALLDALAGLDRGSRVTARDALIRLLPGMAAADGLVLSEEQRTQFYGLLFCRDKALVLAALKALEQVGDRRATWYVEAIMDGSGQALAWLAGDPEVKAAAEACWRAMKHVEEARRLEQTLLRPAEPMNADSGLLLRPAQGVTEADSNLLLRPAEQDQN